MSSFISTFRSSISEMKKVHTICNSAMLIALYVILHFFLSIQVTPLIRISFSTIAIIVAGVWYGPVTAGVVGAFSDILSYLMKPTGPFFPGFTLNVILVGMIYGFFLYHKAYGTKLLLIRIIAAKLLCTIVIEILLTPIWLSALYGNAYFAIVQARLLKQAIMFPIDVILAYSVVLIMQKTHIAQLWQMENK